MNEADREIIRRTVSRMRVRLWLAGSLRRLVALELLLASVVVLVLAGHRILYSVLPVGLRDVWPLLPLVGWLAMGAAPLVAALHRVRAAEAARHLDERAGFQERVLTAWMLLGDRERRTDGGMAGLIIGQAAECCRRVDLLAVPCSTRRLERLSQMLAAALVAVAVVWLVPPYRTAAVLEQEARQASAELAVRRAEFPVGRGETAAESEAMREALAALQMAVRDGEDAAAIARAARQVREQIEQLNVRREARAALSAMSREGGATGQAVRDDEVGRAARRALASAAADDNPDSQAQDSLQRIGRVAALSGEALGDDALAESGRQVELAAAGGAESAKIEAALSEIARAASAAAAAQGDDESLNEALARLQHAEQQARQLAATMLAAEGAGEPEAASERMEDRGPAVASETVSRTVQAASDWQMRRGSGGTRAVATVAGGVAATPTAEVLPAVTAEGQQADQGYVQGLPLPLRQLVREYFDRP